MQTPHKLNNILNVENAKQILQDYSDSEQRILLIEHIALATKEPDFEKREAFAASPDLSSKLKLSKDQMTTEELINLAIECNKVLDSNVKPIVRSRPRRRMPLPPINTIGDNVSKPTTCGVEVLTWSTEYDSGKGIMKHIEKKLFGGNIGHAAICLTIPFNSKSEDLINKYCKADDGSMLIPYREKEVTFADGRSEKVYEIYFSVWPSANADYVALVPSQQEDQFSAWANTSFDWNKEFKQMMLPMSKKISGMLFSPTISLGPIVIEHSAGLSEQQRQAVELQANSVIFRKKIDAMKLLQSKIKDAKNAKDSTDIIKNETVKNLINTLNDFVAPGNPGIKSEKDLIALNTNVGKAIHVLELKIKNIKDDWRKLSTSTQHVYSALSVGTPPTGRVNLSIAQGYGPKIGASNGLDVEKMLETMHQLVLDSTGFNLYDKNCSKTVLKVLQSGAPEAYKSIFAEHILTFRSTSLANPQIVYNTVLALQQAMIHDFLRNTEQQLTTENSAPEQHPAYQKTKDLLQSRTFIIPVDEDKPLTAMLNFAKQLYNDQNSIAVFDKIVVIPENVSEQDANKLIEKISKILPEMDLKFEDDLSTFDKLNVVLGNLNLLSYSRIIHAQKHIKDKDNL